MTRPDAAEVLAVVSDIHGNLPALEAVIADLQAAGATGVVNLGDALSGPLWPALTADRLMSLGWPTLCGNHERQVLGGRPRLGASDAYAAACLGPVHRRWMASLPATRWLADDLYACHGTPGSDLQYFLETVVPGWQRGGAPGVRAATANELRQRLGDVQAALTLCGHSHLSGHAVLDDGRQVLNPGSVGLPAYDDIHPHPHVIENGSPQARYALVRRDGEGRWIFDLRQVDYDAEASARQAEAQGRGDWADALRTGRVGRLEHEVVTT